MECKEQIPCVTELDLQDKLVGVSSHAGFIFMVCSAKELINSRDTSYRFDLPNRKGNIVSEVARAELLQRRVYVQSLVGLPAVQLPGTLTPERVQFVLQDLDARLNG